MPAVQSKLNTGSQLSFDWGDAQWLAEPRASGQMTSPFVPQAGVDESLLAPFAHPHGNRSIAINGRSISYLFTRAKRKSIAMRITALGLEVRAPRFCLVSEVNRVLADRGEWILQQLVAIQQREAAQQSQAIAWRSGGKLPVLGATLTLKLLPEHRHAGPGASCPVPWRELTSGREAELWVPLPPHSSEVQVKDTVQAWLMQQAREIFTQRLNEFAPKLGVQWQTLKLSSAQTRWGSASRDGSIRLNWRLIHGPIAFTDYVVVHELSHLREMNHSPRFWRTVASVMPNYQQQQRELQEWVLPPR
ncbi:MAG: hypothetical protein RL357_714 [Pseudomonadota bacterium]